MIKRYTLHIEFHWGYWPRISFKRVRGPGEKVFDGGEWGTLKACPECSGVGLLHVIEPKQYMQGKPSSLWPASDHASPPALDFNLIAEKYNSPEFLVLDYTLGTHAYKHGDRLSTRNADYVVDRLEDNSLYLIRKDVWDAARFQSD